MTSYNHPTQDEPIHSNENNKSFNLSQIQQQQMIQQSMHNSVDLEQSTFASINVPNKRIIHELAQPQKIPVQYQQPLSVSLQNNNLVSDGLTFPSNDIEYPSLSKTNFKSVTPESKAKNSSITIKEEESMPCNNLQDCKLPSWKFNARFPFPRKPSTKKKFHKHLTSLQSYEAKWSALSSISNEKNKFRRIQEFSFAIHRGDISIQKDTSITGKFSKHKIQPFGFVACTKEAIRKGNYQEMSTYYSKKNDFNSTQSDPQQNIDSTFEGGCVRDIHIGTPKVGIGFEVSGAILGSELQHPQLEYSSNLQCQSKHPRLFSEINSFSFQGRSDPFSLAAESRTAILATITGSSDILNQSTDDILVGSTIPVTYNNKSLPTSMISTYFLNGTEDDVAFKHYETKKELDSQGSTSSDTNTNDSDTSSNHENENDMEQGLRPYNIGKRKFCVINKETRESNTKVRVDEILVKKKKVKKKNPVLLELSCTEAKEMLTNSKQSE